MAQRISGVSGEDRAAQAASGGHISDSGIFESECSRCGFLYAVLHSGTLSCSGTEFLVGWQTEEIDNPL